MQVEKNPTPAPSMMQPRAAKMSFWTMFWLAFFGVLLASILITTAAVAKTGVVRVPVMSSIVSTSSDPGRRVAVPAGTPTVQQTLQTQFEGAVARFGRVPSEENRNFELRLSESSFTKSLQSYTADIEKQFPGSRVTDVQLAVDQRFVEIYLRLERNGFPSTLRIRFVPDIENGAPKITFKEIRLGSLPLPTGIASALVGKALEANMRDFAKQISSVGTITEFELRPGVLVARGVLATGVLSR